MLHLFSFFSYICGIGRGGLAQLARACDWQSQGQGFDSPNLHLRPPVALAKEGFSIINLPITFAKSTPGYGRRLHYSKLSTTH